MDYKPGALAQIIGPPGNININRLVVLVRGMYPNQYEVVVEPHCTIYPCGIKITVDFTARWSVGMGWIVYAARGLEMTPEISPIATHINKSLWEQKYLRVLHDPDVFSIVDTQSVGRLKKPPLTWKS